MSGPQHSDQTPHDGDLQDQELTHRLEVVTARIARAAQAAGRDAGEVTLLLAAKTQPAERVRAAVLAMRALGLEPVVGENRVQELAAKAPELADLGIRWHVIGHLQSNKVNHALRWADAVDSLDSLSRAERVAVRARAAGRTVEVSVQVNVSGEESRHGVDPDGAVDLALAVAALDGLRLTGLMTVGANSPDESVVRAGYARLRALRDAVLASGAPGSTGASGLSMGMSGDLEWAVAEGATVVRLGTAVFGARPKPG